MARTIDSKSILVRAQSYEKEHDKVAQDLEDQGFFTVKLEKGFFSTKAVGLFTGLQSGQESEQYKCALNGLKDVIADYMFHYPNADVKTLETGIKMFISHKMDRSKVGEDQAVGMTTYVLGANTFLDHLAKWNLNLADDANQSTTHNARAALRFVFANKNNQNVHKQILAECMSNIFMIKGYILENNLSVSKSRLSTSPKKKAEGVLPVNDAVNLLAAQLPKIEEKAEKVESKVKVVTLEKESKSNIDQVEVNELKNKFTNYAKEREAKIVDIVKNDRFADFATKVGLNRNRVISNTSENFRGLQERERTSEAYKVFNGLKDYELNKKEKSKLKEVTLNNTQGSTTTTATPPISSKKSAYRSGMEYSSETYPVTYRADFKLKLPGVVSPKQVFVNDHDCFAKEIRSDLQGKLLAQYTSIDQHKTDIKQAEKIKIAGTREQKIALAKKWQEDYVTIVRNLKSCSPDESTDLVIDKIIADKELDNHTLKKLAQSAKAMNDPAMKKAVIRDVDGKYSEAVRKEQNFAAYSDEDCINLAIDKYIKTQQAVAMKTIENVDTKIRTNSIEQPRLDNMVRMMGETTRYHHMLAQAIFVRATYLELCEKATSEEQKNEYIKIAEMEIEKIKKLAINPRLYADLYTGKKLDPEYRDDRQMLEMFNSRIKEIEQAGTENELHFAYNKIVKDWIGRGHTIPANMIADYAQELNIPQKYVKTFITYSGNHYEFANLSTPGNGMNCGLYSLLMLAFAYYNPNSRVILDLLMNTQNYKLSAKEAEIFNASIQESRANFNESSRSIRTRKKTVRQALESISGIVVHPKNEVRQEPQKLKKKPVAGNVLNNLEPINELDQISEEILLEREEQVEAKVVVVQGFVQGLIKKYPSNIGNQRKIWMKFAILELRRELNQIKNETEAEEYEEITMRLGIYIKNTMDRDKRLSPNSGTELWSHFDGTAPKRENKKPAVMTESKEPAEDTFQIEGLQLDNSTKVKALNFELEKKLSMKQLTLPTEEAEIAQNLLIFSKLNNLMLEKMYAEEAKQEVRASKMSQEDLILDNDVLKMQKEIEQEIKREAEQGLTVLSFKGEAQKFFTDSFVLGKTAYLHMLLLLQKSQGKKPAYTYVNYIMNSWISYNYEKLLPENKIKLTIAILEELAVRSPSVHKRYSEELHGIYTQIRAGKVKK